MGTGRKIIGFAACILIPLAAGALGLGLSELLAGVFPGMPSLVVDVGSLVIANQPAGAKGLVVGLFGTNDKLALTVGVVVVALLAGAVSGLVARRSFAQGAAIVVAVGAFVAFAALQQPLGSPLLGVVNAACAVAMSLIALRLLLPATPGYAPDRAGFARGAASATNVNAASVVTPMPDWARRRFLLQAGAVLAVAAAGGAVGRLLLDRRSPAQSAAAPPLPTPLTRVPALTAAQSIAAPGITPIVTSNDSFYRIDTELLVPQVDASTWSLKVTGQVDHPLTFSYVDLLRLPLFEQYVTIACVSNPVGGPLVGNALWTGVRLRQILEMAGPEAGASQIVGRSVDGFTVGFPTAWALDPSREPMVVVGMNRKPLPAQHGYPARLIVPGLYGYVSATKWLAELQLTTLQAFDAYWIRLGWAKQGPIVTQSRIDHPGDGASMPAGPVDVDGVAWAGDRGVSKVQVQVDDGPWQDAQLSRAISKVTWVQWLWRWPATQGSHKLRVRAVDGRGQVQSSIPSGPGPAGATGLDEITVSVG